MLHVNFDQNEIARMVKEQLRIILKCNSKFYSPFVAVFGCIGVQWLICLLVFVWTI